MATKATKSIKALRPRDGDVLLMIGTMKGAFLFHASSRRSSWKGSGPHFPGRSVYAMAYDGREGRHRLWAGPQSMHFGAELQSSDDFGGHWDQPAIPRIRFPEATGASLKNIWQIEPGRDADTQTLYCGVEPAALFQTGDGGKEWSLVRGLWENPHREKWMPGGGGLGLHTIVPHPTNHERLTVAISTGGVYRTDDGGKNWAAKNKGVRAEFLPDKYPEFGQCVHKIARHPARPDRLFLQNHWGLYRSDDAGDSWKDIANGVPSDFGFGMAMHPVDENAVYILPIESDGFRCVPEARLRVYCTRDAGKSWRPLTRGLPQKDAYETVLRDSLAVDPLDPAGVYFGTRSGKLFGSRDNGRSWKLLRDGLPAVTCVKAAVVRLPKSRSKAARKPSKRRAA